MKIRDTYFKAVVSSVYHGDRLNYEDCKTIFNYISNSIPKNVIAQHMSLGEFSLNDMYLKQENLKPLLEVALGKELEY